MAFFKLFEKKKKSAEEASEEFDIPPPPPLSESTIYSELPTFPEKEKEALPQLDQFNASFEKAERMPMQPERGFYDQLVPRPRQQKAEPFRPEPHNDRKALLPDAREPRGSLRIEPLNLEPFKTDMPDAPKPAQWGESLPPLEPKPFETRPAPQPETKFFDFKPEVKQFEFKPSLPAVQEDRAFAVPREMSEPARGGTAGPAYKGFIEAQRARILIKDVAFISAFSKKFRHSYAWMGELTRKEEAYFDNWHKTIEDMQRRLVLIDQELERG